MHRSAPKQHHEGFDFNKWLDDSHTYAREHIDNWIKSVKQKFGTAETRYASVG